MNRRKQIETYTSIEKCVYDRNRKIFNDIEIIEGLSVKQVDSEKRIITKVNGSGNTSNDLRLACNDATNLRTRFEDFKEVQADKSTRGMPWHWEPMKDVTSCDKLRGGANIL